MVCIFCRSVSKHNDQPTTFNTLTIVGGWNSNYLIVPAPNLLRPNKGVNDFAFFAGTPLKEMTNQPSLILRLYLEGGIPTLSRCTYTYVYILLFRPFNFLLRYTYSNFETHSHSQGTDETSSSGTAPDVATDAPEISAGPKMQSQHNTQSARETILYTFECTSSRHGTCRIRHTFFLFFIHKRDIYVGKLVV